MQQKLMGYGHVSRNVKNVVFRAHSVVLNLIFAFLCGYECVSLAVGEGEVRQAESCP